MFVRMRRTRNYLGVEYRSNVVYDVSDAIGAALVSFGWAVEFAPPPRFSDTQFVVDQTGNVALSGLDRPAGFNLVRSQTMRGGLNDAASWSPRTLLITAGTNTPAATVYWPWVIRTDRIANPLGRYYMYYTTDHSGSGTPGGVFMSYADELTGPWTSFGQVYVDAAAGSSETETASVVFDVHANQFRMFYHQISARYGAGNSLTALGVQSTLSATSTNGINWTKDPNFVIDVPALADVHGDGHTGYFLPFDTRRGRFAYSLYGGGGGPDFVLWRSNGQSQTWYTDGVNLGYELHLTQGTPLNARRVEWNSSFVVESGGIEYLVARLSNGASGAASSDCLMAVAPISADYRKVMERPTVVWTPTQTWESVDLRSICPYIENGVLYVFYSIDKLRIGVFSHVL